MKRLLIFLLLGPPLGSFMALFVLLPAIALMAGDITGFDASLVVAFIILLPTTYMTGIAPAALVCAVDAFLASRNVRPWRRVLWSASAGAVIGFLPLLTSLLGGYIHGLWLLLFVVVGAFPGAVCSWLAGRWDRTGHEGSPPSAEEAPARS